MSEGDGVIDGAVAFHGHVHRIEAGCRELAQHLLDPVDVRRHERISGRLPSQPIGGGIGAGHALARPSRRFDGQRLAAATAPLEHADAFGRDGALQPPDEGERLPPRQALQQVVADDEIEGARLREKLVRTLERDVGEAAALRVGAGEAQHRVGPIDGDDAAGPGGERQCQPAGAAAVFEGGHRRELRDQRRVDGRQHPGDERLAAGEELALVLRRQVRAQEPRVGHGREVGFARRERLPGPIGATRH